MSPVFAVIDTNVLVAALLTKHNDSATVKVLKAVFSSQIVSLYNDEIINEYKEVLNRKKFNFSKAATEKIIKFICENGLLVERINSNEILPDLKDLPFYEVCLGKSDDNSFLVTGNTKHFPNKPFIITPSEMIVILEKL